MTPLGLAAFQFVGVPYLWGGNDYRGLDCSGFIVESFRSMGYNLEDMTSQMLYDHFRTRSGNFSCFPAKEDCLLFYSTTKQRNNISHVSIALNNKLIIEAAGAGQNSLNMTRDDLLKDDARVRIRPINYRGHQIVASIKVKYD